MANATEPLLHISSSPHIRSPRNVTTIMRDVVIALIPVIIASVIIFGMRALLMTSVAVISAVLIELLFSRIAGKPKAIGDWSAVITGILVAANVPVGAPLWIPILGSAFAIVVVKWTFGGLGNNFINPALAGRAFLLASYPVYMTGKIFSESGRWGKIPTPFWGESTGIWRNIAESITPQTVNAVTSASQIANDTIVQAAASISTSFDAVSGATPIVALKYGPVAEYGIDLQTSFSALFFGDVGGCIGETSVLAILIGAIWMLYRRVIGFTIPTVFIATVFVLFLIFNGISGASPLSYDALSYATFQILSGGLFFGAVFMATDMVTSPITIKGQAVFALGCGVLTFVIRKFGGYPEGVSYSILLMNIIVPLIDRYVKPRVYGTEK